MIKLIFVFLASFWLSCGNTPQTTQNKTTASEEETENIHIVSTDTILPNKSKKEETEQNLKKISKNKEAFEQKEELSKPVMIVQEKTEEEEKTITIPNHSQWNNLLAKYVNDKGDVDYKEFQNDVVSLDQYLNNLAENSPEKKRSKNQKLAYYINLYNAATVKLILDNYPTKSIKDIKNPWGKKWVKTGDRILSLGDIEHKILRKMNEPRIHFAINCASYSCPKLLNQAFIATNIEAQLEKVTKEFINDISRNTISKKQLQLSNIFKWYKKDFTENGVLVDYINPYTEVEINDETDIDYLKYDWNLNEAK